MPASRTTSARACCSGSELLLALVSLFVASCNGCASRRPIISVEFLDRASAIAQEPSRLDRTKVEAQVTELAGKWPGFTVRDAKGEEIAWQLVAELQLVAEKEAKSADGGAPKPGEKSRVVATSMSLFAVKGKDGAPPKRYEASSVLVRDVKEDAPIEPLVTASIEETASQIGAAIELESASDEKILAALSGTDHGKRTRAIVMSGERKLKGALPKLMELVRDDDEQDQDAVLKAIGAMVSIGDPVAVGALIDAGRRRSSAYLNQILFAVAQLGGKEAEAYLFTVSTGHTDPEVKKNANEALEELQRRKEARQRANKP
jgi:hypothetical protein